MNFSLYLPLVVSISLLTSFGATAQDTIPSPIKKDTLILEETVADIIKSDSIQEIEKPLSDSLLQKIENVKIATDFSKELKDHPTLEKIDEAWKGELIHHDLFDSIQKTIYNTKFKEVLWVDNLSVDTLKVRLKNLNARTPFNIEYNPALESVIKRFLNKRHQSMERLIGLSKYYFPLFEEVLDKYNLPLEIKYLAIVESALKPRARSRVGATGLWQFMYGTGKMYGLNVNSYVDERMDPVKATEAAAKYLAKLYSIFGDWDLALAAYNSGPGNVSKAIRRSGGYTNYWNIRPYLPRETAGYLPAFLATMYIFEYADKHNFEPTNKNYKYFETDTIQVKQQIALDQVAKLIDEKIEVLQFLNPQYKLDVIPFLKKEEHTLRLPYDKVGDFVMHEEAIYTKAKEEFDKKEKVLPKFFKMDRKTRYRIRNGDNLGSIARKFGVRVSDLKRWNGLRSNNIRAGKYLSIYPRRIPKSSRGIVSSNSVPKSGRYTVRSGDSLWSIANRFSGVSVENLRKWNSISSNKLKPGMRLRIK